MLRNESGFSLVEILVASLLISVVAAGTVASFVASARITHEENASTMAQAGGLTEQVISGVRSSVDAQQTFFTEKSGRGWQTVGSGTEALVMPSGSQSNSTLSVSNQNATSQYQVVPQDCDGDGAVGDCYSVTVRQCWDNSPDCT